MTLCEKCIHQEICATRDYHDEADERAMTYCSNFKDEADVAEVRRGEWIYHECVSSYDGAISGYSCSECCVFVDEEMFDADEFHKSFCGNCGADMRDEKDEK